MTYREHPPPPALSPFVDCFWHVESRGEPRRILPDGAMDVLFTRGASGARVVGAMTRAIVTGEGTPSQTVGVRFRPGGAVDLLGIVASELRDETVMVADVCGAPGRTLDAQLCEATSVSDIEAALEDALLSRASGARLPDARIARAVALLDSHGGEIPIPAVAAHVGLGERQLERLFDERVGHGPKAFARVVRLGRAARAIALCPIISGARLAIECGYADQAHLVREFRALTALTPRQYAASRMSEIDNPAVGGLATVST